MRVLLDACVPQSLRHKLPNHQVETARYARLEGLVDAELLNAAEYRFDAIVTCDRSVQWQQNMSGRSITVVVLAARTNRIADLLPLVPELLQVLQDVKPGEVREIGAK